MKRGKIITHSIDGDCAKTTWEFTLSFENAEYGPYSHVFHRKNLYFDEETEERGSFYFPLKDNSKANYDTENVEIFLETNDIVIWVWERGSFSWTSKKFVEIINLKTAAKYRFYPEGVSLIYNSNTGIIIYYTKSGKHKKLELDKNTLEKKSETSIHLVAFFKLFYNHTDKKYGRLIYVPNSTSHTAGYFKEEMIISDAKKPVNFHRKDFSIFCDEYWPRIIDVWEASLTWEIN